MSPNIQRKSYQRLLRSILLSPPAWIALLPGTCIYATKDNWWGAAGYAAAVIFIATVCAYFWHDNLPVRYWMEEDELVVEDVSGEVLRYTRWVQISSNGILFLHGQTASRTVSLPVGGYVAEKGAAAHATQT